jgi:hypothetical protein
VESTSQPQALAKIRIYQGSDGDFALYQDDGTTYAYEKSGGQVTNLHWIDGQQRFSHSGAAAWSGPDSDLLEIVHVQSQK